MKIEIGEGHNITTIDPDVQTVTLREVYNGVGIETDRGRFGIAMRDSGIEVLLNGELVWSSEFSFVPPSFKAENPPTVKFERPSLPRFEPKSKFDDPPPDKPGDFSKRWKL